MCVSQIHADLDSLVDPNLFVGRAPEQVRIAPPDPALRPTCLEEMAIETYYIFYLILIG